MLKNRFVINNNKRMIEVDEYEINEPNDLRYSQTVLGLTPPFCFFSFWIRVPSSLSSSLSTKEDFFKVSLVFNCSSSSSSSALLQKIKTW